jgi:lipopolysaccharide transport system ATP-binding protein
VPRRGTSTLLKILSRITEPIVGEAVIYGRVGRLQVGTGFHPELSGRENIPLNGPGHTQEGDRTAVR